MPKLEIVWRNREPVKHIPRRHSLEKGTNHVLYLLQEFVHDGDLGYWTTICELEVLVGAMPRKADTSRANESRHGAWGEGAADWAGWPFIGPHLA